MAGLGQQEERVGFVSVSYSSRTPLLALWGGIFFALPWSAACAEPAAPPPKTIKSSATALPSDNRLSDIIVTARRREELLQRVPASVVTLSSSELEARSVTNTRSLQNFVPNLTFAPSQNVGETSGNIFIRGIGQEDFAVGAEPGVGFYVDGVYFARTSGTLMNLIDVERIEVLRGPQGTLFGKNTIGGAVRVVSVGPKAVPQRRASVIIGKFGRIEGRAAVNQPLSSRLFARLSVGLVRRDGYLDRLAPPVKTAALAAITGADIDQRNEGAERSLGGRLQLRWLATDALTVDFSVDGSRFRGTQSATHLDALNPAAAPLRLLNRLIGQGRLPGPPLDAGLSPANLLESYATGSNDARMALGGASVVLARRAGGGTLKLLVASRRLSSRVGTDTDGTYFDIFETDLAVGQQQHSGELQFDGSSGALSYTTGLFAFRESSRLFATPTIPLEILYVCGCFYTPGALPSHSTVPRRLATHSFAGYAQGNFRLTDRLKVTLGARLSHERKSIDGTAYRLDTDLEVTKIVVATGRNANSWNALTYRAGADFQATDAIMAYASIARGTKSGGFNSRAALELPNLGFAAFAPETALTFEIGARTHWFDRRLRLNATLFTTDYHDIQLRRQTLSGGLVTTLIENAARARINGAEVEFTAIPFLGLTVTAAYGHIAARYIDVAGAAGITTESRFQRSPSHSFSTSINFRRAAGAGRLELQADFSYRSKEQFQTAAAINDQQGYGLLGARITYRAPQDRWALALFGTNLSDERYRTAGRGTTLATSGFAFSNIGMPRQIGLQLSTDF